MLAWGAWPWTLVRGLDTGTDKRYEPTEEREQSPSPGPQLGEKDTVLKLVTLDAAKLKMQT